MQQLNNQNGEIATPRCNIGARNDEQNIIVTGSLAFDLIMDFPGKFADNILPEKIHQINLSFLVDKLTRQRGGTAGNIAYNLALLGEKPILLGTAGNDFFDYKKSLEEVNVDTSMIYIIEAEPTASAYIFTDQVDNQITGFYPGAMRYSNKLRITDVIARSTFGKLSATKQSQRKDGKIATPRHGGARNDGELAARSTFVIVSPNDPLAMMNFVKECQELKIDYMFDPGMQLPRLSDSDLKLGIEGAKIVIGNDYEMALISKRLNLASQGYTLRGQIWITTLGEKGCEIAQCDQFGKLVKYQIPPAKPREVVDPTGAGDAFRAGFLSGFLSGQDLETCGKMGNLAAVYTVEKYGTQTHKYTKKEFEKRYKENYKIF